MTGSRAPADERATVLLVDFPGRRPEGHLTDLEIRELGYNAIDLLGALDFKELAPTEIYDATLAAARETLPLAVIGYCLAAPLAEHLAVATGAPLLIVLEAQDPTQDVLLDEICAIRETITSGSIPPPPPWLTEGSSDLEQVLFGWREILVSDVEGATGLNHDEEPGLAVLLAAYLEWIAFLLATQALASHPPRGSSRTLVQIDSAERARVGTWGRTVTASVTIHTDREGLLAHEDTGAHVLTWLARVTDGLRAPL